MLTDKAHIVDQLKEHILSMQGIKPSSDNSLQVKLEEINESFPRRVFPLASIHEFINEKIESIAATKAFISHIISQLMLEKGVCVWISSSQATYVASLKNFSVDPERIVFIKTNKAKELLWVMEETLKCEGICAVVCEIKEISFTESRRLQLAAEKGRVTGFIIRNSAKQNINACVARWRITPLPSGHLKKLPGVGFPRWNIELLKIRNGRPHVWQMEFAGGKLYSINPIHEIIEQSAERKIV